MVFDFYKSICFTGGSCRKLNADLHIDSFLSANAYEINFFYF